MVSVTAELLKETDPPVPFYNNGDKTSFAHKSAAERWPVIIAQVVDDVHRRLAALDDEKDAEAIAEGQKIITQVDKLKYDESRDRPLTRLDESFGDDITAYNEELALLQSPSWFNVPWLYSECYLYRTLRTFFSHTRHWQSHDPFLRSKDSTFRSSRRAVVELAVRYEKLVDELKTHPYAEMSERARRLLWLEMAQISLWGNATDLSLLTSLSYDDLQKLQGAEAIAKSQENIISNDLESAWSALKDVQGGRIDLVLDNAGFELFADLVLATYLLETGHADHVILHPKDIPWFVSDVTPADVAHLFSALASHTTYFGGGGKDENAVEDAKGAAAMDHLVGRWTELYADGRIVIRPHPFWTTAHPFGRLGKLAPELVDDLKESDLVVFKGDLNYRKLVGDAVWPPETSFKTAIGSLAQLPLRVLALRTCKADVCVGLQPGIAESLDDKHGRLTWRTNGKFAVVQYHDGK
ncbi:Hairy/enhancer-of-split with YRPW motif protein 2 [Savitreella phatthalungensis]